MSQMINIHSLRNFKGRCALRVTASNIASHALPISDGEQLLDPVAGKPEDEQIGGLLELRVKLTCFERDVPAK